MLVGIFEEGDQIFSLDRQLLVGDPVRVDGPHLDGVAGGGLGPRE